MSELTKDTDDAPTAEVADDGQDQPKGQATSSNRLAAAALAVAVFGVALGGWAALRSGSPAETAQEPSDAVPAVVEPASAEEVAAAKTAACNAFQVVTSAVSMQTHADGGGDPATTLGIAANARLAMLGGGTYLEDRTGPATPPELAEAITVFADGLQDVAMHALVEVPMDDPAQATRLRDADAAAVRVNELCA